MGRSFRGGAGWLMSAPEGIHAPALPAPVAMVDAVVVPSWAALGGAEGAEGAEGRVLICTDER